MATYKLTCEGCRKSFTAGSPRAKWCGHACRKRAQRKPTKAELAAAAEAAESESAEAAVPGESGLYASVRRDLVQAGRLDTTAGQLALELARDLRTSTSKAGLSKELRAVLAEALEGVESEGPAAPDGDEIENEIEAARVKREAKIRAATRKA